MNLPLSAFHAEQIHAAGKLRSSQTCHLRTIEMAKAMQEIASSQGAATYLDLIRAGFSNAEITEFTSQAQELAAEWKAEARKTAYDNLDDMTLKVRLPSSKSPPMTENFLTSPAFFEAWGRYCAGRSALLLDPWAAQRERCIMHLGLFLNMLPLLPVERARLMQAAEKTLPKIAVTHARALA